MKTLTLTHKNKIAEAIYEAYGDQANWLTFNKETMRQWSDLPPEIQEAWRASAQRAYTELLTLESLL